MQDNNRDTDIKNTLLDSVGEGEGWMIERIALKNVYFHMWNRSPALSSMCEMGHSKPMHWDDPEEWDGERGWRGIQDAGHMYTHGWFMSMYGKNHDNIGK